MAAAATPTARFCHSFSCINDLLIFNPEGKQATVSRLLPACPIATMMFHQR
jgi:hypothetical protein